MNHLSSVPSGWSPILRAFCLVLLHALVALPLLASADDLKVAGYQLISQVRVGRTIFDYTYQATLENSSTTAHASVSATLTSTSAHTIVIDGSLSFGDVASGATATSSDTFTIRHDRLYPFSWTPLVWNVASTPLQGANTRTVGPVGGTFEFPSGITLVIPSGALDQTLDIELTELSCSDLEGTVLSQQLATHRRHCLRGFSVKPDGLHFNAPLKAVVPVQLGPGEIPVRIEVDASDRTQWIAETNLVYRKSGGVVEMMIAHFSDEWLAAFANVIEQTCKRCSTYMSDLCGSTLSDPNPWFGNLQPGACLLLKTERTTEACGKDITCCMEDMVEVTVTDVYFSGGACQIAGGVVNATFPTCAGAPTQSHSEAETIDCPADAIYKLDIVADDSWIYRCEQTTLLAEMTATGKDGKVLFEGAAFPAFWEIVSGGTSVTLGEEVPVNGKVVKATTAAGQATIRASAIGADDKYADEYTLTVRTLKPDILPGDDVVLFAGNSLELWAPCLPCQQPVNWDTDREGVVRLDRLPNGGVNVTAIDRGTARVFARSQDKCGEAIEDSLIVEVRKTEVVVTPDQSTIAVGHTQVLSAAVTDGEGCTLNWYSNNLNVADVTPGGVVTGMSRGTANISAVCGEAIGLAVITVTKTEVTVMPSQATITVGSTQPLTATVIDGAGCTLRWYSNDVSTASVTSNGLVTGVSMGTANISAACGGATGVSVITVTTPRFFVQWSGTHIETKLESCSYAEGPWTYNTRTSWSWVGSATVENHRKVVSLSTDAHSEYDSVCEYVFDYGPSCIDRGYQRSYTLWTLNQNGRARVKSTLEGHGVYITNPGGSGFKVNDPLLGGGCAGPFGGYHTDSIVTSGTCPPLNSEDSSGGEAARSFCFPIGMSGPLTPDDETLSTFSKTKVHDLDWTGSYDCAYGVVGTQEISTHIVWEVKVIRLP